MLTLNSLEANYLNTLLFTCLGIIFKCSTRPVWAFPLLSLLVQLSHFFIIPFNTEVIFIPAIKAFYSSLPCDQSTSFSFLRALFLGCHIWPYPFWYTQQSWASLHWTISDVLLFTTESSLCLLDNQILKDKRNVSDYFVSFPDCQLQQSIEID